MDNLLVTDIISLNHPPNYQEIVKKRQELKGFLQHPACGERCIFPDLAIVSKGVKYGYLRPKEAVPSLIPSFFIQKLSIDSLRFEQKSATKSLTTCELAYFVHQLYPKIRSGFVGMIQAVPLCRRGRQGDTV